MVVKVRQVQGWNLQTPQDAKLMASTWKQQFERKGIDHRMYDKLIDMAIDHRTRQISMGMQPTPLTVELLLSCFDAYSAQAHAQRRALQGTYNNVMSVIEQVRAGMLPREIGFASLLSVGTESDEELTDFDELAACIAGRLEQKLEGFNEEYYLS